MVLKRAEMRKCDAAWLADSFVLFWYIDGSLSSFRRLFLSLAQCHVSALCCESPVLGRVVDVAFGYRRLKVTVRPL